MKMINKRNKQWTKNDFKQRLSIARKRSKNLHHQIGILSSSFAWLETRVIEMLSQCVNDNSPGRARDVISQLSFRQCITLFRQFVPIWFPEPEITSQVKEFAKRLDKVSIRRNEIIHSYWVNYSPNIVAQQRPRSKGGKPSGFETYDNDIINEISLLVEAIDDLLFDLDSLFSALNEYLSEQGHAL
jgi:hypothetical protein